MYVCMYVCIYVFMYVCLYVCMYASTHERMCNYAVVCNSCLLLLEDSRQRLVVEGEISNWKPVSSGVP